MRKKFDYCATQYFKEKEGFLMCMLIDSVQKSTLNLAENELFLSLFLSLTLTHIHSHLHM